MDNENVKIKRESEERIKQCKLECEETITSINKTNSKNLLLIHNDLETKKLNAIQECETNCQDKLKQYINDKEMLQNQIDTLNNDMKEKEKQFDEKLVNAVNDAKKYVYDKAEAQFNAGNAKYQNVKAQFKEKQSENIQLLKEIDEKNDEIQRLKEECEKCNTLVTDSKCLNYSLNWVVSILKQYEDDHSCTLDFNYQFDEDVPCNDNRSIESIPTSMDDIRKNVKQIYDFIHSHQELNKKYDEFEGKQQNNEKIVMERDAQIIEYQSQVIQLENKMAEHVKEIEILNQNIDELKKEHSIQLTLMAKLTTTKVDLENNIATLNKEKHDLNERCLNLRNMNNELMLMLEQDSS